MHGYATSMLASKVSRDSKRCCQTGGFLTVKSHLVSVQGTYHLCKHIASVSVYCLFMHSYESIDLSISRGGLYLYFGFILCSVVGIFGFLCLCFFAFLLCHASFLFYTSFMFFPSLLQFSASLLLRFSASPLCCLSASLFPCFSAFPSLFIFSLSYRR